MIVFSFILFCIGLICVGIGVGRSNEMRRLEHDARKEKEKKNADGSSEETK